MWYGGCGLLVAGSTDWLWLGFGGGWCLVVVCCDCFIDCWLVACLVACFCVLVFADLWVLVVLLWVGLVGCLVCRLMLGGLAAFIVG